MTLQLIDIDIVYPNGERGVPARSASIVNNENAAETEQRLTALESGGAGIGNRLDSLDDAVDSVEAGLAAEGLTRATADQELEERVAGLEGDSLTLAGRIRGRNGFINGDFRIWQSGTAFAAAQAYYAADGWICSNGASTGAISRLPFASSQSQIPGNPKYFLRYTLSSVAGANNYATLRQRFEGATTYAGQTVTVSFWVRANAARQLSLEFAQRTGNAGEVIGIGVRKISVSTAWEKKIATVAIPIFAAADVGVDILEFLVWLDAGSQYNPRTDSLGQQGSGVIDFARFKIEEGDVATEYEPRSDAEEMILCQGFYEVVPMWGTSGVTYTANGDTRGATIPYKVTKRRQPSFTRTGTLNVVAAGSEGSVINVDLGTVSVNGSTSHCYVSGVTGITGLAPAGAVVAWGDNRQGSLTAIVDARL
jgi:hypothetical protein